MRVGGRWKYLFRAVDKYRQLIDFMLSDRSEHPSRLSLLVQSPLADERLSAIPNYDR
ncbi:DDE-type integrase/transposase/recombinase [Microvirga makkahensis]|uniref:DDE-type integrase/transposase/recombinase n=1 Tax=Microvirga makkahensis TaxID=1128670 RepID=A0A7X3MUR6_9HYPH|nr:DDE-type integrase/transposase/recombinase [Microvirga makkahensis]